jgi:hypothetical protein
MSREVGKAQVLCWIEDASARQECDKAFLAVSCFLLAM